VLNKQFFLNTESFIGIKLAVLSVKKIMGPVLNFNNHQLKRFKTGFAFCVVIKQLLL